MSAKTVLTVKVDKKLRDRAKKTAKELGVPLSLVINNELKRFANERQLVVKAPLVPNKKTRKILDGALKDIHEGNINAFSPRFSSVEEANAWLDSDDK